MAFITKRSAVPTLTRRSGACPQGGALAQQRAEPRDVLKAQHLPGHGGGIADREHPRDLGEAAGHRAARLGAVQPADIHEVGVAVGRARLDDGRERVRLAVVEAVELGHLGVPFPS
ncbi:hypothetical protein [Nonomuraea cypriaca]|uniref:hypothetical protein n=1 Tax=Nonomuraea cypriaca TaxID=1187855 RepID=UPI001A9C91EC|nr:hypothetical protein [Nonomuraea cypriaca]